MFEGYIMNLKMVNNIVFVILNLFKVQYMLLSAYSFSLRKTPQTPKSLTLIQRC